MQSFSHLKVTLHVLFLVGTHAARVRQGNADSEARSADWLPGQAFVAGPTLSRIQRKEQVLRVKRRNPLALGGISFHSRFPRGLGPRMQESDSDPSWWSDKNLLAEDEWRKPQRTKLDLRKVLEAWSRDAWAREVDAEFGGDAEGEKLMKATQRDIWLMQYDIEKGFRRSFITSGAHVFGVASGKASAENMQALASVSLRAEEDPSGKLNDMAQEQGFAAPGSSVYRRVPVVYISELIASPSSTILTNDGAGELVHGIIPWAKDLGRLVTILPVNEQLREYFKSLGFVDASAGMMVYRSSLLEEQAPSGGPLLDLWSNADLSLDFSEA